MIRALVVCALVYFIGSVSAETGSNKAVIVPQPTVAAPAPIAISACGKANCPGTALDPTAKHQSPQHALLKQKLAEMNCLQSEIEELRRETGTPQLVQINVQVLEVSRTKLRKLGTDISMIDDRSQSVHQELSSLFEGRGGSRQMQTIDDRKALFGFIDWIQDNNAAKVLANPLIVTTCGRPTQFHVGGEIPIPSAPDSKQPVSFMNYGTEIDVLADAIGDHRVKLNLRARISELDEGRSLNVGGERVPALSVRQIDTGIELQFGQTGILSGLVQHRPETIMRGKEQETVINAVELLFLVTPDAPSKLAANPRMER